MTIANKIKILEALSRAGIPLDSINNPSKIVDAVNTIHDGLNRSSDKDKPKASRKGP